MYYNIKSSKYRISINEINYGVGCLSVIPIPLNTVDKRCDWDNRMITIADAKTVVSCPLRFNPIQTLVSIFPKTSNERFTGKVYLTKEEQEDENHFREEVCNKCINADKHDFIMMDAPPPSTCKCDKNIYDIRSESFFECEGLFCDKECCKAFIVKHREKDHKYENSETLLMQMLDLHEKIKVIPKTPIIQMIE